MADRTAYHTTFAASIGAREFRELLQAGKDVRATLESRGWAVIAGLLEEQLSKRVRQLVDNAWLSEREYAVKAAEIRGLEMALQAGPTVLYVAEEAMRERDPGGEVDDG